MARLLEILEKGKKAIGTTGSIYSLENNKILKDGEPVEMVFSLLTNDTFKEYDHLEDNFDITEGYYYFINGDGDLVKNNSKYLTGSKKKNFNRFPEEDKKLAEYINKKQLLERKMLVFSYLNGGQDIDMFSNEAVYCIEASLHGKSTWIDTRYSSRPFDKVYFKDRKTAETFTERNGELIEEVMNLRKELGF